MLGKASNCSPCSNGFCGMQGLQRFHSLVHLYPRYEKCNSFLNKLTRGMETL